MVISAGFGSAGPERRSSSLAHGGSAQEYDRELGVDTSEGKPANGCRGLAATAVLPINDPAINARLWVLIAAEVDHPDLLDARSAWRRCMSDAGHPYREQEDAITAVLRQKAVVSGLEVEDYDNDGSGSTSTPGTDRGFLAGGVPQPIADEDLAGLRDFEIAVATADRRCARRTGLRIARNAATIRVLRQLEHEFSGSATGLRAALRQLTDP